MSNLKTYLAGLAGLCLLQALSFYGGYNYHRKTSVPQIVTNTVIVHDTTKRVIIDRVPYYIVKRDTIVETKTVFTKVDTAKILQDYYAIHYYTRTWQDSLLKVTLEDAITENVSIDNKFTYEILRPQSIISTTVNNSVVWSKRIYFGLDIPIKNIKYINLEGIYDFKSGYIGMGYYPELKSLSLKAGVKLFQFD